MFEARKGQFLGSGRTSDSMVRFEQEDRDAISLQLDCRGQAVGTRTDNNRVVAHHPLTTLVGLAAEGSAEANQHCTGSRIRQRHDIEAIVLHLFNVRTRITAERCHHLRRGVAVPEHQMSPRGGL